MNRFVYGTILLVLLKANCSSAFVVTTTFRSVRDATFTTLWSSSSVSSNNSTAAANALDDAENDDQEEDTPRRRRVVRGPIRLSTLTQAAQVQIDRQVAARQRQTTALQDVTLLDSSATYHSVNPVVTLRALTEVCGVDRMTVVQSRTYAPIRQSRSVLAISKTGTGKTLAALVPLMEQVFSQPSQGISLLILAPTRELVQQLGTTANELLTFYPTKQPLVQVVYGGTSIGANVRSLERHMPRILVTTPGRLVELLETKLRGRQFLNILQQSVRHVYLDEADLLLDQFAPELLKLAKALPRRRQVLLFSATWPKLKHQDFLQKHVVGEPLDPDLPDTLLELDCVTTQSTQEATSSSSSSPVNLNVQEYFLSLSSMDSYLDTLVSILQHELSLNPDAKIVVFFPAAKLVQFLARVVILDNASGSTVPISAIHSRMSQAQRQRTSQDFRTSTTAASILFSSDVSARGMDYPNVTTVLQYGLPSNRELYWHRLGRTARAGQHGKGIVVALPFEPDSPPWLPRRNKKKKPIMKTYPLPPEVRLSGGSNIPSLSSRNMLEQAQSAYKAFVAYYVGTGHYEPSTVLSAAQDFASSIGLMELPELPETLSSLADE